jgi:hypothetical protein
MAFSSKMMQLFSTIAVSLSVICSIRRDIVLGALPSSIHFAKTKRNEDGVNFLARDKRYDADETSFGSPDFRRAGKCLNNLLLRYCSVSDSTVI